MLSATETYRTTEVLTATPQKLHLMLLDTTLRHLEQARTHGREGRIEEGGESVVRAREILSELLAGLNREANPELACKISSYYLFAFNLLVEAHDTLDDDKLSEAIEVIQIERETWARVCKQQSPSSPLIPKPKVVESVDDDAPVGLSLEA